MNEVLFWAENDKTNIEIGNSFLSLFRSLPLFFFFIFQSANFDIYYFLFYLSNNKKQFFFSLLECLDDLLCFFSLFKKSKHTCMPLSSFFFYFSTPTLSQIQYCRHLGLENWSMLHSCYKAKDFLFMVLCHVENWRKKIQQKWLNKKLRMRESCKRFVKTWIHFANPWIRFVSWSRILTPKRFVSCLTKRILDSYRIVDHESWL